MPATIQQVRRRITQRGGPDAARLLRFADLLFSKTDQGLFETFGSESLHAIAVEGLSFLANRKGDDIMVKVYNPSHQVNGWEGPYTVIALLLEGPSLHRRLGPGRTASAGAQAPPPPSSHPECGAL